MDIEETRLGNPENSSSLPLLTHHFTGQVNFWLYGKHEEHSSLGKSHQFENSYY